MKKQPEPINSLALSEVPRAEHRLPPKELRKEPGLLLSSKTQREACFQRDHGKCAACGCVDKAWHADHIVPLWLCDRTNLDYFRVGNLQTLCEVDHKVKTRKEARARAKVNRIRDKRCGEFRKKKKMPSYPFPTVRRKIKRKPFVRTPVKFI